MLFVSLCLVVYEHCIFPDARRVAPIRACVLCLCLVLVFSGSVLCLHLVLAFSGSGTFTILQKLYLPSILHLTLIHRNSLIINTLFSVRCYQFHLHATYTTLMLPHGTSTGGRHYGIGGAEKSVAPTDCSTSLCRITRRIRPNRLRGSEVRCVRCVQGCVRYFGIILHS